MPRVMAFDGNYEQLRRSYQPPKVQLLFIGESPPASGRFFYARNSGLYRAMLDVFAEVDCVVNDENFLAVFQAAGCYLVDLCPEPVDHLPAQRRRAVRISCEMLLARSIAQLRPRMIATLLRSVESNVTNAILRANWNGRVIHLPYPGRWAHLRNRFTERLTPEIVNLLGRRASAALRPKTD